jgi:hypothetical protein
MFGEPADNETECNARLFLGDNYGDGTTSIRCQLVPDHQGLHKEEFERNGRTVTITWAIDERVRCNHGCGQWEHAHHDEESCPKSNDNHEYDECPFCHPGEAPTACEHCGKRVYYMDGHLRDCTKKPFTCAVCGVSGIGNHDWPSGCPNDPAKRCTGGLRHDEYRACPKHDDFMSEEPCNGTFVHDEFTHCPVHDV